jgi:hypothetical protein
MLSMFRRLHFLAALASLFLTMNSKAQQTALTAADYARAEKFMNVLPQHPADGWEQFSEEEIEALVYRLGNMTLMLASANRAQGDDDYASKRPAYAASGFELTRKLAEENAEWTPGRIAARQTWMSRQAAAIWRIAQLS